MNDHIGRLFGLIPRPLPGGSTPNKYRPGDAAVPVGIGRCKRKGHRPPNKDGFCTRCGVFIRVEDLNVGGTLAP